MERSVPVTGRLSGADLFWPHAIGEREVPGLARTSLLRSSERSWLVAPEEALQTGGSELNARGVELLATEPGRPRDLAVALTGRFPTAFPEGAPAPRDALTEALRREAAAVALAAGKPLPERAGERTAEAVLSGGEGGTVVVMGNADWAASGKFFTARNQLLFENLADWLMQESELVELRAALPRDRRIKDFLSLERERRGLPALEASGALAVQGLDPALLAEAERAAGRQRLLSMCAATGGALILASALALAGARSSAEACDDDPRAQRRARAGPRGPVRGELPLRAPERRGARARSARPGLRSSGRREDRARGGGRGAPDARAPGGHLARGGARRLQGLRLRRRRAPRARARAPALRQDRRGGRGARAPGRRRRGHAPHLRGRGRPDLLALVQGAPAGLAAGSNVRLAGENDVYRAPALPPTPLAPAAWLDTHLVSFQPASVRAVVLSHGASGALDLLRDEQGWRVQGAAGGRVPRTRVERLLQVASNLIFADVIDAAVSPETGFGTRRRRCSSWSSRAASARRCGWAGKQRQAPIARPTRTGRSPGAWPCRRTRRRSCSRPWTTWPRERGSGRASDRDQRAAVAASEREWKK
jgi:hypothetical protein